MTAVLDLADPEYWTDPYPVLRAARAHGRVARTHTGEIALLCADDAEQVYTDPRFTVPGLCDLERLGIHDGPFYEWRRHTLAVMEGPKHQRLRNFVGPSFSPRSMARLRRLAAERAEALLSRHAEAPVLDVVRDFASDLPLWTMCRFVGIDDDARERLGGFLVGLEEGFTSPMTPERRQRVETAVVALDAFVREQIEARRAQPDDSVIGQLVDQQRAGDGPDDDELRSLIVNLVGGAVGSTRAAFSNAILELTRHPEQAELLRAEPARMGAAVEECLRFHPPFRFGRRVVTAPVRVAETDLLPGQSVFVPRQAVNRDPERFTDPDRFDVRRPERRHFSFSYGPHFCLGHAVARVNLQEGLRVFLSHCRDLALSEEPRRIPFVPDEQLASLHVRFRPA